MRHVLPILALALFTGSCGRGVSNVANSCTALSGSSWVPNITGASASNHDSTVSVARSSATGSGPVVGYAQSFTSASLITVQFPVTSDLGAFGSLSLVAQTTGFPSGLVPSAYPVLVSLSDGTNEYVNLAIAGGSDCAGTGFYVKSGSNYVTNSSCVVSTPGMYVDRSHWEDHNFTADGTSVNVIPTCNWSQTGSQPYPTCKFNSTYFSSSKLRQATYTAKYLLLSLNYPSVPSGNNAGLTVTAFQKTDTNATVGGAIDLNVVLVGNTNIQASRTTKGQLNLNLLINGMATMYVQSSTAIKIGTVNAIEWNCDQGGDAYANIDSGNLGTMLSAATAVLPSSTEGKAVNIFLISSFTDNSAILGEAGAIGGPMLNGTGGSGAAFATFNKLGSFNPNCSSLTCAATALDSAFVDMQGTIAHETGHFLGLNHPSEGSGTLHDAVYDTPICTAQDSGGMISINSCLNTDSNIYPLTSKTCKTACTAAGGYNSSTGVFCNTVSECAFNQIMWYTSKNYNTTTGTGDGNLFSTDSGIILNYNPFVQ